MYIAILGRQPGLSMAELESRFGAENTRWFSSEAATVNGNAFPIEQFGGTLKAGKITLQLQRNNWKQASQAIIAAYSRQWSNHEGKITLGISAYGFDVSARDVQQIGIFIKKNLKKNGVSLRLIPNADVALSTATSHHNKLGLSPNKIELLIVRSEAGKVIVAESNGAQNITALAARDQARPKRDAFVGMLPPKLALIMVNLAIGALKSSADGASETSAARVSPAAYERETRSEAVEEDFVGQKTDLRLLDPFCGTGVILQEAALLGLNVYGTDLSEKMIRYSEENLKWLEKTHHVKVDTSLHEGDAMTTTWQQPIDLVASETYLGQPFSAPPSPKKLEEVKGNVNHITTTFLKNIRSQLTAGTPLCLAVPAWRDASGHITHLPFIRSIEELGFQPVSFKNVSQNDLIYYREDQVVARELLVLVSS